MSPANKWRRSGCYYTLLTLPDKNSYFYIDTILLLSHMQRPTKLKERSVLKTTPLKTMRK